MSLTSLHTKRSLSISVGVVLIAYALLWKPVCVLALEVMVAIIDSRGFSQDSAMAALVSEVLAPFISFYVGFMFYTWPLPLAIGIYLIFRKYRVPPTKVVAQTPPRG